MTSPASANRSSGAAPGGDGRMIWVAAGVLVVILGIVAIVVARGQGEEKADGQTGTVQVDTGAGAGSGDGSGEGATDTTAAEGTGALPIYDATTEDPAIGRTIPTVDGQDFDGQPISIAPDGKAKILLFVAHWCPHCQREIPRLQAHLAANPLPDDVELITVSTSVKPGTDNYPPQDWLAREDWTFPVMADDEQSTAAAAFGLSAFPYFVAVDADGKVVGRASGELTEEQFDTAVEAARTGTPLAG